MTTLIRHAGSHAVRPDGVYRSGITAAGWQPGDVAMIANLFTARPSGLAGANIRMLNGLGGWRDWNPFRKIGLYLKSAFSRKKAEQLMIQEGAEMQEMQEGVPAGNNGRAPSGGEARAMADQIAPQIRAQMMFLSQLQTHNPNVRGVAAASWAFRQRRLNTFYRAG